MCMIKGSTRVSGVRARVRFRSYGLWVGARVYAAWARVHVRSYGVGARVFAAGARVYAAGARVYTILWLLCHPSPFGLDFGTLDFGTSGSGLTIIMVTASIKANQFTEWSIHKYTLSFISFESLTDSLQLVLFLIWIALKILLIWYKCKWGVSSGADTG